MRQLVEGNRQPTLANGFHKLSLLFSGREGDPVPAAVQTLAERGQGPLPDLKINRVLVWKIQCLASRSFWHR